MNTVCIIWLFCVVHTNTLDTKDLANKRLNLVRDFLVAARSFSDGRHTRRDVQIIQNVFNCSQQLLEYVDQMQNELNESPLLTTNSTRRATQDGPRGHRATTERINLYAMFEQLAKLVEELPVVIYCSLFVCQNRQMHSDPADEQPVEPEEGSVEEIPDDESEVEEDEPEPEEEPAPEEEEPEPEEDDTESEEEESELEDEEPEPEPEEEEPEPEEDEPEPEEEPEPEPEDAELPEPEPSYDEGY